MVLCSLQRDHRLSLSWECVGKLFKQEMENADDIRLSVRLFTNCLSDKKRFCPDVEPGSSRVKDCLEEHRNDKGFSAACKVSAARCYDVILQSNGWGIYCRV